MPSTVIRKYEYLPEETALLVTFITGVTYKYHGVPVKIFDEFKSAFSKGVYLNRNIKPNYSCEKMTNQN